MRVVIFGANGDTGREAMAHCLEAGFTVVAAVRRPKTVAKVKDIELAEIDFDQHATLVGAMQGADAVVSCIGHGSLSASKRFTDLYSTSTRAYLRAMREAGVSRIIALSSGGVVEDPEAPWFYTKLLRRYLINTYVDMARMETILEETDDIEWTSVRLTYLRKGKSKPFLVKEGRLEEGAFQIHFTDAGRFIAEELEKREWVRAHPVLGYPS
ncbi:MAG: NAD(P)H-binding protein [Pseudomonadota bacterium]